MSSPRHRARLARFLPVPTALAGGGLVVAAPPGWPSVVLAVMLGLFAAILVPYWFVAMTRTRPASEAERRTLRSALGGAPRVRVRVVEDTAWVGNAVAAGILPTQRYVFVATSVFDLLDDEQMAAVIAHEVAHHRRRHVLLRHGLAIAALGYVTALAEFAPWQLFPTVVLGTVPYLLVTRWVVRRTELAADTVAARATTPDALADALERLVDNGLVLGGGSSLGQFFAEHPAVSVRLQRLREPPGDRRL